MYTLKNKLLVSMPNMTDPYFAKSVIFICEYNDGGAVGFIINKPVSTMKIISSGIKEKFLKDLLLDLYTFLISLVGIKLKYKESSSTK